MLKPPRLTGCRGGGGGAKKGLGDDPVRGGGLVTVGKEDSGGERVAERGGGERVDVRRGGETTGRRKLETDEGIGGVGEVVAVRVADVVGKFDDVEAKNASNESSRPVATDDNARACGATIEGNDWTCGGAWVGECERVRVEGRIGGEVI